MLARRQRISRSSDFTRTLRKGVQVRRADVMVHVLVDRIPGRLEVDETSELLTPGPRVGLIVSKAVGDSVTRHTVARRLRAAAAACRWSDDVPALVVLRALPSARDRSSVELARQIQSATAAIAPTTDRPLVGGVR